MAADPLQILELRAGGAGRETTATVAITADAAGAIFIALSEQLDRRRGLPTDSVEQMLALRQRAGFVERFAPLARAGAHAIVQLTDGELRDCLLDLSEYRGRVDGEHYQPPELRERLRLIGEITTVLWDANATIAGADERPLSSAAHSMSCPQTS